MLSPGIHSETAFDQAHLATVLGFPLVESADLLVREGKLWMRSLGSLKRVDVVLRRVDAEYADPLDLRPDSRLGVVGLVEAQRRGTVSIVNTLGSGILESPGATFPARDGTNSAGRGPTARHSTVVLGRYRQRAVTPVEANVFTADQVGRRNDHPGGAYAVDNTVRRICGPHRGGAVAVARPGTAPILLRSNGLLSRRRDRSQCRHAAFHRLPAKHLRGHGRGLGYVLTPVRAPSN